MDTSGRKQIERLYHLEGRRLAHGTGHVAEVIPLCRPVESPAGEILSSREAEVLQLIADGYGNREIGQLMFLSEETVKSHLKNLLRRLRARNRAHAVSIGFRRGLID
jgi:DNA-binding CsgD family transcriptional regulator